MLLCLIAVGRSSRLILRHSLKEKFVFRGQHTKRSQESSPPTRRHVPLPNADTPIRRPADTFPPCPANTATP